MIRAYRLDLQAPTRHKKDVLLGLFDAFHEALPLVGNDERRHLLSGAPLPKYVLLPDHETAAGLSARQMRSVGNMVRQADASWIEHLTDTVRTYITGSSLTRVEKTILYRINARHAWWAKKLDLPWIKNKDGNLVPCSDRARNKIVISVPPRLLRLARRLAKQAQKRCHYPNLSRVHTLNLDSIIARPERPSKTVSKNIAWWVKVASLVKGRPVEIPLGLNPYFENIYENALEHGGKLCGVVQLHKRGRDLSMSLLVETPDVPTRRDGKILGIDYGLAAALMADSDGNLLGGRMLRWLGRMDERMTGIARSMQQQGSKPTDDPEYEDIERRIRDFVTNEVGRELNSIGRRCGKKKVREIVAERLDFRGGGMSRRMNRLITRIGRGVFKKRFKALEEKTGIKTVEVPAQYSSQQCSGCGYVDFQNRPTRDDFRCRFCGKKIQADVGAARTLAQRRSLNLPNGASARTRAFTLHMLDARFTHRWNVGTGTRRGLRDLQGPRAASPPHSSGRRRRLVRTTK